MDAAPAAPVPPARPGALTALVVLAAMNMLNYLDRYVPSAMKTELQRDLGMDDADSSLTFTAFIVVYMLVSPLFAALADKVPRKWVIAIGVAIWSLATAAASLATGFWTFIAARAAVGVGEAAYATMAPALLADFYPPERRSRVITIFYVAIPIGSALGFAIGGAFARHGLWRDAFLVCGLPGLALAALVLLVRDPGRGTFDEDAAVAPPPWMEAVRALGRNRTYVLAVAGYVAVTFASGVLADWYAPYLQRDHGFDQQQSGLVTGLMLAAGGLVGTALGGWLGERFTVRARNPYFLMCAATMLGSAALLVPAVAASNATVAVTFAFAAAVLFFAYNGPLNTIVVNCVPSAQRARAVALSIFAIHVLGDAISPAIAGRISDLRNQDLGLSMALIPVMAAIGGTVWYWAASRLPAGAERGPPASPTA